MSNKFFTSLRQFTLSELADSVGCAYHGAPDKIITGVATITDADSESITFLSNMLYKHALISTKAGACILSEEHLGALPNNICAIISSEPYADYARISNIIYGDIIVRDHAKADINVNANIANTAIIGNNCTIGAFVTIEDGAIIGDESIISHGSYIGKNVEIGKNCYIAPNVTVIYTIMGDRCIIHSGAQIGQDGFGFAPSSKGIVKVPQTGCVLIENDVEIGANTCIDRGACSDTRIGAYTKIDNLVQIAHGARIGKWCFIAGQAGIAGSTEIEDGVIIGGQAGVGGHIRIAAKTKIAGQSGVYASIAEPNTTICGTPAVPIKDSHRYAIYLKNAIKKKKT